MLLKLVSFPVKALIWLLEELRDRAEQELYDESKIRQELLELESRLKSGSISQEQYEVGEQALIDRLQEARRRRLEQDEE